MNTEWKLVPKHATKAMQHAWDSAPSNEDTDVEFHGAYAAMLAAAPPAPTSHPIPTGATGEDGDDETQAILRWIMRTAESAKEDCGMDPETPAAVRNGKLASIASAAAQALGLKGGPSYQVPAAGDALRDRDAALEAVRKRLCALPRYSFLSDGYGAVRRVEGKSASWIGFDAAHELFDPVCVDAAIAQQKGEA